MGEVYAAEDSKLDRQIALKVLPEEMAANPERVARFEREAKAVASLDHPNIVTIHSVEEADGVRFITMQLVQGKTLSELIPKTGLSLERFFDLAIPMADAISAAHEHGVTHRDLKPANVMVTNDGRVKILDFGLAKLREETAAEGPTVLSKEPLTKEGKVMGTAAYMSPEQADGKPVDHRSDIFSLGIILYEMATGQRPFQGDSDISTLSSILRDTPPSVTEVRGSLPRHLGRIIHRCLAKDAGRRYQSSLDLRIELQELRSEVASEHQAVANSEPTSGLAASSRARIPILRFAWPLVVALLVGAAFVAYLELLGNEAAGETRHIRIATADSLSGVYFPMGSGIAQILEREIPDLSVEVLVTDGALENVGLIESGEADVAITQNDVAFHAVQTEEVLGHRSTQIRGLAILYEEVAHILVRADSGIQTIDDLRGKTVNLNLPNSGSQFTLRHLLRHLGIQLTDVTARYMSGADANVALVDGSLDAALYVVASPFAVLNPLFESGGVKLVPIAPELVRGLTANQPFLVPAVIPARTYPNQREEVDTVAVKAMLVASTSLEEGLAHDILSAIFSNISDLIVFHRRATDISREAAFELKDGMAIDLHPGAERFWR